MKNFESDPAGLMKNETTEHSVTEDHEIIKHVINGSVNEYRMLVEKYQVPIYNLFLRMLHNQYDAEELTQIVFIQAYEALPAFRFEHRFFSWIYRIAVNLAINHLKRQTKFVGIEHVNPNYGEADEMSVDKPMLLELAIDHLKDRYKQVVILKYYQQLSYKEVAFALDIPERKVRSRLYDARLQLKDVLEKTGYF